MRIRRASKRKFAGRSSALFQFFNADISEGNQTKNTQQQKQPCLIDVVVQCAAGGFDLNNTLDLFSVENDGNLVALDGCLR